MKPNPDPQPASIAQTTSRNGKIARLPHPIRHQLNCRLQNGEKAGTTLRWLNSLPEVQTVLAAEFAGRPVSPSNLTEWKQGGYRDWLVGQDTLGLVRDLQDQSGLGHQDLSGPFAAKLSQWAALYYASSAQTLVAAESQPQLRWERLHQLCADIARLRRGDLFAERLALDREWLDLEKTNAAFLKEKEFWAWTERPDISAKLHPESRGISVEMRRKLEDTLCLMSGDPFQEVGRLMKNRRILEEAEAGLQPDYVI